MRAAEFDRATKLKGYRIFPDHLTADPGRYVLYGAYSSEINHLITTGTLTRHGAIVWSLWDGYLTEPSGQKLTSLAAAAGIPFVQHHTSGHAGPRELAQLAEAICPRQVVPIHTENADAFRDLSDHAVAHEDGEWWEIRARGEDDRSDNPTGKGEPRVHA